MRYSDKQLLDFLQKENDKKQYTGCCVFRLSLTGRGWRLHETSRSGGCRSVREAIKDGIEDSKLEPWQREI